MKQIVVESFGPPEVLRFVERPDPVPAEGEVLVAVTAAGVNYADVMQRQGLYPGGPQPPFPAGFEVAGRVEALGPGVDRWRIGDRVMGLCSGGYATHITAPAKTLFPVPPGISLAEAAGIPCQFLTAYHALKTLGRLQSGWTVLIHAAAGGLGTQLVQIARLSGARVIGTSSSDEKCALVQGLGCDVAVNYSSTDFRTVVKEETGGKGCELVIESVGGEVFDRSLECVRSRGMLIVIGVASRQPRPVNTLHLLRDNLTVAGFHLNAYLTDRAAMAAALQDLTSWLTAGDLRIIQECRYPLEDAAQAHRDIEQRKTHGKVVLVVREE